MRLRLTLLYGALFLASGAALLTITYVLVEQSSDRVVLRAVKGDSNSIERLKPGELTVPSDLPPEVRADVARARAQADEQRAHDLDQLLVQSGIALGLMTAISIGLGWLMAGRVLRPLRTMTTATRHISEHSLHQRLALEGPDDEIKGLGDTIDGLLARLEAAFEAQRRFVANASHELRTPLTMMRTSLDVATSKPGAVPSQVRVLEAKLREGLDQADGLLEGFLALARAQHGVLPEHSTVSLDEIASAAISAQRPALAERAIAVQQQLDHAEVTGSRALLSRMVENVVDNAVRHNEPNGWMRVETQNGGTVATLVVESGGRPLRDRDVRELAQPFRRLGTERTGSENGVGLGLSIVAAIAAAHDGTLELRARTGGGLRVQIDLPAGSPT